MEVFEKATITITKEKYDRASSRIRSRIWLNVEENESNDDLIQLAIGLSWVEMAYTEKIVAYGEDDMWDKCYRLVQVLELDSESATLEKSGENKVILDGKFLTD